MRHQKPARTLHFLFSPFADVSDAWFSQLKGASGKTFIDCGRRIRNLISRIIGSLGVFLMTNVPPIMMHANLATAILLEPRVLFCSREEARTPGSHMLKLTNDVDKAPTKGPRRLFYGQLVTHDVGSISHSQRSMHKIYLRQHDRQCVSANVFLWGPY